MMKLKLKMNKDKKTFTQLQIDKIFIDITDDELKQFLIEIIEKRPDIIEEDTIHDKLSEFFTYEEDEEDF